MTAAEISADFPFDPHFVEVLGSRMHYVDEGEGDPILLLHGNPTSSYLWRNIIPYLTGLGRVVVPDLIGMGRFDKPSLDYRFPTHAKYLDAFIDALDLKNITLVVHDWGSGLGFHYAHRNEDNVKAIAFMEAIVETLKWNEIPSEFRMPFKMFRAPVVGWLMISVMNVFVNKYPAGYDRSRAYADGDEGLPRSVPDDCQPQADRAVAARDPVRRHAGRRP